MQIEVTRVDVENKGKYRVAKVQYKANGKNDAKQIMSFTFPEVFKTLSAAQQGDVFEVKSVKNDKGYWDWTEVASGGKNTSGSSEVSRASGVVRSSYETAEERAKRQVYIVRQSSVSNAIEFLIGIGAKPITEEDVIQTAKKFEAYVFNIETPTVKEAEVT